MEAVVAELARIITETGSPLDTPRECSIDLSAAPALARALVEALRTHDWDVSLMAYQLYDDGSDRVYTLAMPLENVQDDLDHDLEAALAEAGPEGEPFDLGQTVHICPDEGGMSALGVSWSGGTLSFVVVELEEDPNGDGLFKHFTTPGALFAYLENYLAIDHHDRGPLERLRAAAQAAGEPLDWQAPILSRGASSPATRSAPPVAVRPPARGVYDVSAELDAALAADDAAAVQAALAALEVAEPQSLTLLQACAAMYKAQGAHPERALEVALWLARQPEPRDYEGQVEWRKALSQGCVLACAPGDEALRRELVDRALPQARLKLDILHNAACALVAPGDHAAALDVVAEAARLGYPGLAALAGDTDLVPLRAGGALDAAVVRGRSRSLDDTRDAWLAWCIDQGTWPGGVAASGHDRLAAWFGGDRWQGHVRQLAANLGGNALAEWLGAEGAGRIIYLGGDGSAHAFADTLPGALAILAGIGTVPLQDFMSAGQHGPALDGFAAWLREHFGVGAPADPVAARAAASLHDGTVAAAMAALKG